MQFKMNKRCHCLSPSKGAPATLCSRGLRRVTWALWSFISSTASVSFFMLKTGNDLEVWTLYGIILILCDIWYKFGKCDNSLAHETFYGIGTQIFQHNICFVDTFQSPLMQCLWCACHSGQVWSCSLVWFRTQKVLDCLEILDVGIRDLNFKASKQPRFASVGRCVKKQQGNWVEIAVQQEMRRLYATLWTLSF